VGLREPYGFLDAYFRYDRAREHVTDLRRLIDAYKADPKEIGSDLYPETLKALVAHEDGARLLRKVPIPYEISIRIGEAAYNLRCALDYLVFALAWHDTGVEPNGEWARKLQFPIESKPKRFERRRSSMLKGVSDPHIAMIREYQPCAGCIWTSVLAGLNDSDKHRHLPVLAGSLDPSSELIRYVVAIPPELEAQLQAGIVGPNDIIEEMEMEDRATLDIVFPEGELVSETMEELESEVGALLTRFAAEFTLRPL
jgi:hypothetical protein